MEHLGGGYARENGAVYFASSRVQHADSRSFQYLGGSWARDASRVYSAGSAMRDVDPGSFRVLSHVFAKDAARVCYVAGKVAEADVASFRALDSGCHFAAAGKYPVSYSGYGCDAERVFHYVFTVGKPCVVRKAVPQSFQSLEGVYGMDASHVFVDKRSIKGAERLSWFRLQGLYSRDARQVYYDDRVVEGADLESFICLWGANGTWSKNSQNYYDVGRLGSREQYLEVLAREVHHLAQVKANLLAGRL